MFKNARFDLEEDVNSPVSLSMAGLSDLKEERRSQSPDFRKREHLTISQ